MHLVCLDLEGVNRAGPNIGNLQWRENVFKLAVNEAGYCTAGPLRAPWRTRSRAESRRLRTPARAAVPRPRGVVHSRQWCFTLPQESRSRDVVPVVAVTSIGTRSHRSASSLNLA